MASKVGKILYFFHRYLLSHAHSFRGLLTGLRHHKAQENIVGAPKFKHPH